MMHDAGLHQPARKSLGFAVQLSSRLVGADPDVLEYAPEGERVQVVWSAVSVLLVCASHASVALSPLALASPAAASSGHSR
jgi:hypothetical protein